MYSKDIRNLTFQELIKLANIKLDQAKGQDKKDMLNDMTALGVKYLYDNYNKLK